MERLKRETEGKASETVHERICERDGGHETKCLNECDREENKSRRTKKQNKERGTCVNIHSVRDEKRIQ